jgi:AcrR family transcriptional regulator
MKNSTKRQEIISAALELIAEHGFHGAPMAMIAGKAGVGAGTIYRYFPGKDALITELYHELEDKIINAVMEGYPAGKTTEECFLHVGNALLKYFINNPLVYRYLEQYHNSPYGVSVRRDRMRGKTEDKNIYRTILEQGTMNKDLKDLPLFIQFALAIGPLLMLARDHILGLTQLDDNLINQTIKASWDSIKR